MAIATRARGPSVWVIQEPKTKAKLGAEACPRSIGWRTHEGKRKQECSGTHEDALRAAGAKQDDVAKRRPTDISRKTWKESRAECEATELKRQGDKTQRLTKLALDHFEKTIS